MRRSYEDRFTSNDSYKQQQEQQKLHHVGAPSRGVLRTPSQETKLPELGIRRHVPWTGQVRFGVVEVMVLVTVE